MENQLFESAYSDPKISLAFHKLKNYRVCMFCNHKLPLGVSRKIVDEIKGTRCPVCNSTLPLTPKMTMSKEKRERVILRLNQKRKRVSDLEISLKSNTENLRKTNESLKKYWDKYTKAERDLTTIITEIDDFRLRLADIRKGTIKDIAVYDRDIQKLQKEIDFYESEIEKDKEKYKETKKQLEDLNRDFKKDIFKLKKDLTRIFKEYSKSFFSRCELEIQYDKPKGSKIALPIFMPKVNNVLRKDVDQVSKSEAIFLEYIFRMSLCEIFRGITGNTINLMIETSEGVFDIGVIETVADAFVQFSSKNYLIVISNLGREDFLESLVRKSKIRNFSQKMLNFLEIGKLSIIQRDNLPKYKDVIKKLESISSSWSRT